MLGSTFSYFETLERYLHNQGRPAAFYSDKHTVFRVAKEDAKSGARITQFGRALSELNIEILCTKGLSAVLEHIRAEQDIALPKPEVRTNSEKMNYKPSGRRQRQPSGLRAKKKIVQVAE